MPKGDYNDPFTHAPAGWLTEGFGSGHVSPFCKCSECGRIERATFMFDYYTTNGEGEGGALKCEICTVHRRHHNDE